jgi:hypothetical protein
MDQSIGLLPKKLYAKYYKRQNHAPADSLRLRPLQQDNSLIGPTARFGTGKKKKVKGGMKHVPPSFISQNGIIGDFMSLKPLHKPKSLMERLKRT